MDRIRFYLLFVFFVTFPFESYGHGISSATARVSLRPGSLIELQVQFNFIHLLNYKSHDYALPVIASLPEEKFGLLYDQVLKLFKEKLLIKMGPDALKMNMRFPSARQVQEVLKREFIETKFKKRNEKALYTFSDRRFYQVFYFDFRLPSAQAVQDLSIAFPKELGAVYVTYTESANKEVHPGDAWTYSQGGIGHV